MAKKCGAGTTGTTAGAMATTTLGVVEVVVAEGTTTTGAMGQGTTEEATGK